MNVCGQGGKTSKVDRGLHCKTGGGGANEKSGKKEFLPNGWLFFKGGNGGWGEGGIKEDPIKGNACLKDYKGGEGKHSDTRKRRKLIAVIHHFPGWGARGRSMM